MDESEPTVTDKRRQRRASYVRLAVLYGFIAMVFLSLSIRENVAGDSGTGALLFAALFGLLSAWFAGRACQ